MSNGKPLILPQRLTNPLYRAKRYVDMQAGMPDPAREERAERLRQLSARQVVAPVHATRGAAASALETPVSIANGGTAASTVAGALASLGVGLVLIDSDTFSGVASHSTGAVFTADYADYLVIANLSMSASNTILSGRFRTAGADNSNSNYHSAVAQIINSYTQSANGTTAASTMTLLPNLGVSNTATDVSMTYVVSNPQASAEALLYGQSVLRYGAPAVALYPTGILFNNTTSFDALSLIPASGTITGTIKVFGIRGS